MDVLVKVTMQTKGSRDRKKSLAEYGTDGDGEMEKRTEEGKD